jgi:hypothetical protein
VLVVVVVVVVVVAVNGGSGSEEGGMPRTIVTPLHVNTSCDEVLLLSSHIKSNL